MKPIDQLIGCLDSGVLMISSKFRNVDAYVLRVQGEGEASEDSDFSILTPTQCVEFAYYKPDPLIVDRRDEMPHNPAPDNPNFLKVFGSEVTDWPRREVDYIDGLTIHHTLSDNPLGLFDWITRPHRNGGKGYPRGQYHYWVSREEGAPVYHLLDDTVQCWHDHTGTWQSTLSIGMAGHLGLTRPPEEQLWNTVRLCAHLVEKYGLSRDEVQGHNQRYAKTVCPGWDADSSDGWGSGVWRRDFCIALQCAIVGEEWNGYHS